MPEPRDHRVTRGRSFGSVAAAYARHRPGYPRAAVDWVLAAAPGGDVLDLGAGTGKLTAALAARPDLRVRAVEPDPAMLARLRAELPGVPAQPGTGENIPLPDRSVDAVLIGQAWHWMDPGPAMAELARVLRPGGVLAGLWNTDDATVEWVAGWRRVAGRENPQRCGPDPQQSFPPHPAFGPTERAEFPNPVRRTVDTMIANLATHSWSTTAGPAERDERLGAIRDYLTGRPETGAGEFDEPMITEVERTVRRG